VPLAVVAPAAAEVAAGAAGAVVARTAGADVAAAGTAVGGGAAGAAVAAGALGPAGAALHAAARPPAAATPIPSETRMNARRLSPDRPSSEVVYCDMTVSRARRGSGPRQLFVAYGKQVPQGRQSNSACPFGNQPLLRGNATDESVVCGVLRPVGLQVRVTRELTK
jgi:hypothetical protein